MFDTAPGAAGDGFGPAGSFAGAQGPAAGGVGDESTFRTAAPEGSQRRWAALFERCRGADGFVGPAEGRRQLEASGLPQTLLQSIWSLSDLDRDGRLSLREFVCALQLVDQALAGRPLPADVTAEQQLTMVHGVERYVGDGGRPRGPDEFSTVDTTGSLFGTNGRRRAGPRAGPGRIGEGSDGGWGSGLDLDSASGDAGSACASRLALGRTNEGDETMGLSRGLGQLAAVFDAVARLDAGGELKRLSRSVLEERQELERQLSRRRGFEQQLRELRDALDRAREERRQVEMQTASAQRKISHLQDELAFVEAEASQADGSLAALRAAHGAEGAGGRGPAPYGSAEEERRDVLSKVRAERQLLQRDQRGIEELRTRLEDLFSMKREAQALQQALLEKQRQTEQDRGLMLTAIEAERGKLSAARGERLRLAEERTGLERQIADVVQKERAASNLVAAATSRSAVPRSAAALPEGRGVPATGLLGEGQPAARGVPQQEAPVVVYGAAPELDRGPAAPFPVSSQPVQTASVPNVRPGGYPEQRRADHRGVRN